MASVAKSQKFESSASDLWARVGRFNAIHEWHPLVAATQSFEDGTRRKCTLGDGAVISETLLSEEAMSYTYRIDESPLPLSSYEATISVTKDGAGSEMQWAASFQPDGVSDAEAEELIGGIVQAGFDSL